MMTESSQGQTTRSNLLEKEIPNGMSDLDPGIILRLDQTIVICKGH